MARPAICIVRMVAASDNEETPATSSLDVGWESLLVDGPKAQSLGHRPHNDGLAAHTCWATVPADAGGTQATSGLACPELILPAPASATSSRRCHGSVQRAATAKAVTVVKNSHPASPRGASAPPFSSHGTSESSKLMQTSTSTAKDPICGMAVDTATAIHLEREGKTFYFCGDACRTKFNAAPSGKPPECTSTGCCE